MKIGSRSYWAILILSTVALALSVYNGANDPPVNWFTESLTNLTTTTKGVIATAQDDQDQPPPTPHSFSPGDGCSSVDPKAPNKERNGIKKNTVGCKCVRKCVNGYTQEDLSKDEKGAYICKNACFRDRCFCPDPCKS